MVNLLSRAAVELDNSGFRL